MSAQWAEATLWMVVLLRTAVDTCAIVLLGLAIMRQRVEARTLAAIALVAALITAPLRFSPALMQTQIYLSLIVIIAVVHWLGRCDVLTATAAALLGSGGMVAAERLWMAAAGVLGLIHHALPPPVQTLPSVIPVVAVAAFLRRIPPGRGHPHEPLNPGVPRHVADRLAVAQLFAGIIVSTVAMAHTLPYPPLLLVLASYGFYALVILARAVALTAPLGRRSGLPAYVADLVMLLPAVILILLNTGGAQSEYRFLLLVLVVVNSLKPAAIAGITTVSAAGACLLILGAASRAPLWWPSQLDLVLLSTFALTHALIRHMVNTEESLRSDLVRDASIDALTGLYNYRYLQAHLQSQIPSPSDITCVLMVDLDHFKHFNDAYGHATGNSLLQEIAATLRRAVRDGDVIARYGGDEFVVVLRGTVDQSQATALAERLRKAVQSTCLRFSARHGLQSADARPVTASVGIACSVGLPVTSEDLVAIADGALYEAKTGGRNRVYTSRPGV